MHERIIGLEYGVHWFFSHMFLPFQVVDLVL
jgi:hypothetical protein